MDTTEIISIVNGIVMFNSLWIARTFFFLMIFSLATMQGWVESISAWFVFPSSRWNQNRAKPPSGFWREKAQPNQKKPSERSRKKTAQVWHIFAVIHKHILKLNGTVLCDKNYVMDYCPGLYPWSSEGVKFKMHINMNSSFSRAFELPI